MHLARSPTPRATLFPASPQGDYSVGTVSDGRFVAPEERVRDIFLGDGHLDQFFRAYLIAAGLVNDTDGRPSDA